MLENVEPVCQVDRSREFRLQEYFLKTRRSSRSTVSIHTQPEYFASVDKAAKEGGNISIISVGWDPGMFSLNRLYAESILVQGSTYTFWGKGVSQGHSDAIRRIEGVKNAIQYTVPIESAMELVRSGSEPTLTTREKHLRECYVVAEEGADKAAIEKAIKTMPNYFDEYDTTVNFISEEELKAHHSKMPHGGFRSVPVKPDVRATSM